MPMIRLLFIALTLAALASCTSREHDFKKVLPIMKESASARALVIEKCMSQHLSPEALDQIAFFVKSQRDQAKQLMCERVTAGLVSGKINYSDFNAIFQQKKVTPALIAVLKGR